MQSQLEHGLDIEYAAKSFNIIYPNFISNS
jgi:hypothetical protein